METITNRGIANKNRIDALTAEIQGINELINDAEKERAELVKELIETQGTPRKEYDETPEINKIKKDIIKLQQELKELEELKTSQQQPDTSSLMPKKNAIQSELNQLNRELGAIDQIDRTRKEIATLEKQQRDLSQRVAEIERTEYRIAELGKLKLSETERLVNEKFKYVQFRLFKFQKNGGEELVCDAMVDGVPFDSLNSAARINAGLDIINALCRYNQVNAPVFLDNAESVNKTIETKSQLIKFYVTKDKQLIIA